MTNTANIQDLKAKSKLPANKAGGNTVAAFFEANKATIKAVLPSHVGPDRMLKIALGALRTTPKLMNCTVESLFGAVVQCAQMGLEPNTAMGHAYLIPFDKKKHVNGQWIVERTDVQLIIGYKGMLDLARRSGQIVSIAAHEVCENDEFTYRYGLDEKCDHVPAAGDRGKITHFYAVAKLKGGGHVFEVMSVAQVEEIRDASQNYKSAKKKQETVWGQHFAEMGRKTVTRRLFKWLPCSLEMATAALLDEKAERKEFQNLAGALDGDYVVTDVDEPEDEEQEQDGDQPAQIAQEQHQEVPAQTATQQQADPQTQTRQRRTQSAMDLE